MNEAISPEIQTVNVGESMTIFCDSDVKVNWTFNDEKKLPKEVKHVKYNTIGIKRVDIHHRGLYECVGKRSRFKFVAQSHLNVASKYKKLCLL